MALRLVCRDFSASRVRRSVFRVLRENVLCSMSTVRPPARAHINTAYFAYTGDLVIYFLSNPRSTHALNLQANPSMGMTIFRSDQEWTGPDRGIQLFGTCAETRGRGAEVAARVYGRRFPEYPRWVRGIGTSETGAALLRSYRSYRFAPRTVKVLDEREFPGVINVIARIQRRPAGR